MRRQYLCFRDAESKAPLGQGVQQDVGHTGLRNKVRTGVHEYRYPKERILSFCTQSYPQCNFTEFLRQLLS